MTVTKTIQGYYQIMTIKNNRLVQRLFIGYTKKEAISEFKIYLKTQ